MERPSLLFVYGTLTRNQRRHHWLLPYADYLGAASIAGRVYRLPGKDYPGAAPSRHGRDRIYGELYRLREPVRALRVLDRVEDCPAGEFRRALVELKSGVPRYGGTGERMAWTYVYALPLTSAERIPGGRYRLRVP